MAAKRTKQKADIQERRYKALELRKSGASLRAIGQALDCSKDTVAKDIQAALDAAIAENVTSAESLRQMELERLDMALLAIHPQVRQGHLGAIDRWIKLSESRRKLIGLDAPVKQEHDIKDWRYKAIEAIQSKQMDYQTLADELGHDLATELFQQAGVVVGSQD